MVLSNLSIGSSAIIASVKHRRLEAIGIRIGATVEMLRKSYGCLHFRIGMTEFAIRKSDENLIEVISC